MKVLMTADAVGGVWTYALELADALEPHGVEVAIATMGPPPSPAQRADAGRTAATSLHVSSYALEWMDDPWHDVDDAGFWLLDLANELQPDVVHLNGFAHARLAWRAPVVVVGHSCVLSWWYAVRRAPPPPHLHDYATVIGSGARAADMLVAPTHALLAEFERLYEPQCERLVIPNGRRAIDRRAKDPFVLAAGRAWDEAKNLGTLDIAAEGIDWPVLIAGEGGGNEFLHARPLGNLDRATVDGLLGRASIFAAPARYEPFGLAALEAATAACALVLGDIPSLREVWDDAAWFVDPDDPDALGHALATLTCSASRRNDLAERARQRARRYTPERMATRYVDAYGTLSGAKRATEAVP